MSDSKKTSFRPSKNFMFDEEISFVNSPIVVIVARIVSPGCVLLCWIVNVGIADAKEIRNMNKKIVKTFFIVFIMLKD